MTPGRLNYIVQRYLQSYFTTRSHLKSLLMKRIYRSVQKGEIDEPAGRQMVEELLDRLEAAGLLNDAAYTDSKVRMLLRRGNSRAQATAKLATKGISAEKVQSVLREIREEQGVDPDVQAAENLARRRKLGPYRDPGKRAVGRDERREQDRKDLAVLGRAGFSYAVAHKALQRAAGEEEEE